MVDVNSMCICPCGFTSTTSQSTSLLYHSTSGGVISSGPSDQSSQIFYNGTINGNNTSSASASLSSSLFYCPCSPATSTSYMSCKHGCREKEFKGKMSWRIENIYLKICRLYMKEFQQCRTFFLLIENLMQILFSYFAVHQIIISTLSQSMSPSSTESTSFRPSVSSQSDNMTVGLSLTPTPPLPLTTRTSAVTEVSSQGGFFSSSFSSFVTQSASLLMSESITFFVEVRARKVTSKSRCLLLKGF